MEIQLSNPLISFTLDRVLKDVAKAQVEAFEKRCRAVPFDNESIGCVHIAYAPTIYTKFVFDRSLNFD